MDQLMALVSQNENWVLRRVIDYAKVHEYTRYTSTLIEAWRISISSLNDAMRQVIQSREAVPAPHLGDQFNETGVDQFSIAEVHRHRARGITLGMFLGLVKYYRRGYLDLVRAQAFVSTQEHAYLDFLERFFDRFEIGYSVEWNALSGTAAADELRAQNRALTNEKNKYLTIFESLYDPVILLGPDNVIENINQAAAELFQAHHLPARRYYDQHPADQVLPWLAPDLARFAATVEQEWVVLKTLPTRQGDRHFQVKMKRMQDVSEKYRGTVLILNDLTERLQKEEALTLNRATQHWVNTLVDLGRWISNGMETDEILLAAMTSVGALTQPEAAVLGLWEPEAGQFRIRFQGGGGALEKADWLYTPPPAGTAAAADFPWPIQAASQVLPIPLEMNEAMIGQLWVSRPAARPFTLSERIVLESIAQQMSIAIEHAAMTAQIQSSAIVEERARLAREMHDGLSQILGFLSLEMQSLESLVEQQKIPETLAELQRARQRIREAQAEVRENILNLRTALSQDGEAINFLVEYLDEFGAQTGLGIHVEHDSATPVKLASLCEVQLVRIVQEALTNVRLHAQARHVWVKFAQGEGQLRVEIRDDGVGLVEKSLKKHFGLTSMRERTASVNGRLEIHSAPGRGTQLTLCLPLADRAALAPTDTLHAQPQTSPA